MYVDSLLIEKFRCFEHAEIPFQHPNKKGTLGSPAPRLSNVNLLLGNNGSGKSAILKALALAILSPVIQNAGFRAYLLVRRLQQLGLPQVQEDYSEASVMADITLHKQDIYPTPPDWEGASAGTLKGQAVVKRLLTTESIVSRAVTAEEKWRGLFDDAAPAFFMAAYGATRRVESSQDFDASARNKFRSPRYQRVASIFEDHIGLVPLDASIQALRYSYRRDEGVDLLNKLLPNDVQLHVAGNGSNVFQVHNSLIPFEGLSDGHRAFIGWVVDLLYHMCQVTPIGHPLTSLTGIVMVDEIDLHLHPEWQRTVVETVAATFPNIQFIFSTHSPLVAGTLEAANIFITEIDVSGAAVVRRSKEHVHGLSADQILTGSYFGLATTRAVDAENQMNALAEEAWAGDQDASLEYLKRLTEGFDAPSESGSELNGKAVSGRKARSKAR